MVKAAFGASYRSETAQQSFDITNLQAVYPFSRKISAAYGEVSAPLVSESNALPWLKSLVLSVAGRYEHYSDFGHTANPRVGLALKPTDGLTLRATYSTSFRAPNNLEETGSSQGVFYDAADTASPTGTSTILYLTGVNNHLTPETARNVTFGLDIRPIDLPALLLSVDYYHIDYSNRIVQPDPDDEGLFSLQAPTIQGLVTRSPTSAEVLAALANVGLLGNYTGNPELNPGSVNPAFVQAIVNALYQNFAVVRTDGIDFSGSYLWESPLGRLHPSIQATYIHSLEQQLSPDSAFQSLVNTIYNPPKFRGRLGIAWDKAGWNSAVFVNYVNAYTDNRIVTTPVPISSWTTADFHIGYTFADNFSLLGKGKTEIALDVTNFLNKEPPYVSLSVGGFNYDPANSSALGRVLAVGIVKSW
jgi:outer membrane receptor protein involved in Fe transport